MEDEVRDILRMAVAMPSATSGSIVDSIRARIASTGGVELAIPAREPMRDLAVPEP
jgi:plasmid stability protein